MTAVSSADGFTWSATNQRAQGQILGLMASYTGYTDGQFGWVIVDGVNIQSVAVGMEVGKVGDKLMQDPQKAAALTKDRLGLGIATVMVAPKGIKYEPGTLLIHGAMATTDLTVPIHNITPPPVSSVSIKSTDGSISGGKTGTNFDLGVIKAPRWTTRRRVTLNGDVQGQFILDGSADVSAPIEVDTSRGRPFVASAFIDTTDAYNITAGVLGNHRGGAGPVLGILKADGNGNVSAAVPGVDYIVGDQPWGFRFSKDLGFARVTFPFVRAVCDDPWLIPAGAPKVVIEIEGGVPPLATNVDWPFMVNGAPVAYIRFTPGSSIGVMNLPNDLVITSRQVCRIDCPVNIEFMSGVMFGTVEGIRLS
jgi:hypothetical protein